MSAAQRGRLLWQMSTATRCQRKQPMTGRGHEEAQRRNDETLKSIVAPRDPSPNFPPSEIVKPHRPQDRFGHKSHTLNSIDLHRPPRTYGYSVSDFARLYNLRYHPDFTPVKRILSLWLTFTFPGESAGELGENRPVVDRHVADHQCQRRAAIPAVLSLWLHR